MRLLVICGPFKQESFGDMLKFMNVDSEIMIINEFYDKYGFLLPTRTAWRKMCEFEPDAMFTDCIHYPQFYSRLYSKFKGNGTRLFTYLRGNFWIERESYFKNLFKRRLWVTKGNWLKKIFIEIPSFYCHSILLSNKAIQLSDKILPVCRWLEKEVNMRIPNIPTEIMYQGINTDVFFKDEPYEWEHPSVGILQNHSIYPKTKGLIDFGNVIEKLPHVHFYIAGGESWGTGYFGLVKEALSKYPNVHFKEEVPHPEGVRRFLNSCDVYALPSGLDCCPTSVLEASLCGKPVLGSRIGGIPETIREGETGWSIPNENVEEWVRKISFLLEDRRLSHKMGEAGSKFVEGTFSWKVIAKKLEGILKS
jgi:glycosyltransferase involved in cell wall biosynthesis